MLQCKYYNRGWQSSLIHQQLSDKNRPNHNACIHTVSIALFFLQAAKKPIFSYRTICALLHWHQQPNSRSSQSKCAVRKRKKKHEIDWIQNKVPPLLPNSHTQTKPTGSVSYPLFTLKSALSPTLFLPSLAQLRDEQRKNMSTNSSKQNTLQGWKAMQEQVVQCAMTVNK